MSNTAQNPKSRVPFFATLIYFLIAGTLVTFATLLGGVVLAAISGGLIGLFIALTEPARLRVMWTVAGLAGAAYTTLIFHALGAGTAGLLVGPVVFMVAGYIVLIFLASFFADTGR